MTERKLLGIGNVKNAQLMDTAARWVVPSALGNLAKDIKFTPTESQLATAEKNVVKGTKPPEYQRGSKGFTIGEDPQTPGPRPNGTRGFKTTK